MAQFQFLKGNYSGLNSVAITEGQLLITKDTRELFVDVDASTRIKIGDFTMIGTLAELEALDASTVPTSRLYYVEDTNIFCKSTGSAWAQINKDTGATSVEVVGEGNAITDASYDPATRKLTLTKGETFATKEEHDDLAEYVGTIPNGEDGNPMAESVVAYINKKTDGIATSGNLEALGNRVTTAEGEIDALQEASATHATKDELNAVDAKFANYKIAADQKAIDDEQDRRLGVIEGDYLKAADIANFETKENVKKVADDLAAYVESNDAALAAEAKARGEADTALEERIEALEGNFGDGEGTVESKIESAVSAETEAREEAVKGVQDEVDALETKVGEIPEGATATTVVGYVDEKVAAETKAREEAVKGVQDAVDAMYTNDQIDTAVQGAKDYAKDLVDALPEQTDYTVTITENTDDATVAKTYVFTQNGAEIGAIKLAKELVVTSGSVKEVETADTPYAGAKVGEKYIELVIANQDTPIYVPAKDLVDIYTAGANAAEVQVAISNTNEITATLVNGGIAEEKLAEGVKTKLNKVWEEVGVAAGLVSALENGQVKTNKEAIEAINNESTGILAQAKEHANGLNTAMNARVEALEAIDHDHANKTVLDGITAEKVAAWDAAEKNAKDHADGLNTAMDNRVKELEAIDHDAYIAADTTLKGEIIGTAEDASTADTINGAKKYADEKAAAAQSAAEAKVTELAGNTYTKEEVENLLTWGEF